MFFAASMIIKDWSKPDAGHRTTGFGPSRLCIEGCKLHVIGRTGHSLASSVLPSTYSYCGLSPAKLMWYMMCTFVALRDPVRSMYALDYFLIRVGRFVDPKVGDALSE